MIPTGAAHSRAPAGEPAPRRDVQLVARRTYRYVRASMVGVLLALATAVVDQSVLQGRLLASISAYYYTPAQAVFVGALVGLGLAMVALKGTTTVEDVLLNLGGMLAMVVAVVPTSRGADFRAAVQACRAYDGTGLTGRATSGLDCPTVTSLVAATRANVQNNMVALLVTGALGLAATLLFAWIDQRRRGVPAPGAAPRRSLARPRMWGALTWGFGPAVLLYLVVLVTFMTSITWFIAHAHYMAAAGLFLCIVAIVVANAVRKNRDADAGASIPELVREKGRWYLALAVVMVVVAVLLGVLVAIGVMILFWLEAALVVLFAVFWVAQTWEQWEASPVGATH